MTRPAVVLLAAGEGSRLRPVTDHVPKPLVPVREETLLGRLMRQVAVLDPSSVTVCVGYRHDLVGAAVDACARRLDLLATTVRQTTLAGPFDALRLALEAVPSDAPVVVANADLWMSWDPRALLRDLGRSSTAFVVAGVHVQDASELGELEVSGREILALREKSGEHRAALVNAGVYALGPDLVRRVRRSPPGHLTNADVLVAELASLGTPATLSRAVTQWEDVGSPGPLLGMNLRQLGDASWIADSARVHPRARLVRSVVCGESWVGAGSRLEECVVLPGTRVPSGTTARRSLVLANGERCLLVPADLEQAVALAREAQ